MAEKVELEKKDEVKTSPRSSIISSWGIAPLSSRKSEFPVAAGKTELEIKEEVKKYIEENPDAIKDDIYSKYNEIREAKKGEIEKEREKAKQLMETSKAFEIPEEEKFNAYKIVGVTPTAVVEEYDIENPKREDLVGAKLHVYKVFGEPVKYGITKPNKNENGEIIDIEAPTNFQYSFVSPNKDNVLSLLGDNVPESFKPDENGETKPSRVRIANAYLTLVDEKGNTYIYQQERLKTTEPTFLFKEIRDSQDGTDYAISKHITDGVRQILLTTYTSNGIDDTVKESIKGFIDKTANFLNAADKNAGKKRKSSPEMDTIAREWLEKIDKAINNENIDLLTLQETLKGIMSESSKVCADIIAKYIDKIVLVDKSFVNLKDKSISILKSATPYGLFDTLPLYTVEQTKQWIQQQPVIIFGVRPGEIKAREDNKYELDMKYTPAVIELLNKDGGLTPHRVKPFNEVVQYITSKLYDFKDNNTQEAGKSAKQVSDLVDKLEKTVEGTLTIGNKEITNPSVIKVYKAIFDSKKQELEEKQKEALARINAERKAKGLVEVKSVVQYSAQAKKDPSLEKLPSTTPSLTDLGLPNSKTYETLLERGKNIVVEKPLYFSNPIINELVSRNNVGRLIYFNPNQQVQQQVGKATTNNKIDEIVSRLQEDDNTAIQEASNSIPTTDLKDLAVQEDVKVEQEKQQRKIARVNARTNGI